MKPTLAILILALSVSVQAADVVIDLGDAGTLTITDTQVAGVNILACMRAVLDRYEPPLVNEETGEEIPWTVAQYKAILVQYLGQRGKAQLARALQIEFESRLAVPDLRTYITLEAAP